MANREELAIIRDARAGRAAAQLALGKLYLFGSAGLPQSMTTALHWLERAAIQGNDESWMLIGTHIPYEIACQYPNKEKLSIWYEKAFDAGITQAGLIFAKLILISNDQKIKEDTRNKALLALEASAHAGLADAQWLFSQFAKATQDAKLSPPTTAPTKPTSSIESNNISSIVEELNTNPVVTTWAERAADGGVTQAQRALAEQAWIASDWPEFLRWSLPFAREIEHNAKQFTHNRKIESGDVSLLSRCAQAMIKVGDHNADEIRRFMELAAQENDKAAQLALGLWLAKMDLEGQRVETNTGAANFKKAIKWLTLAGEQGSSEAWYALSRIYLKPEFSQRNLADAQRYLERAAEMLHSTAQFECGAIAWRSRREFPSNDIKAVYWLQKSAAQGNLDARDLLEKIATPAVPAVWAESAQRHLTREIISNHPLLVARIELAAVFGLSRPEALLLNINEADCGHCLVVDIRANFGRSKRRLIVLETGKERQVLDRIKRIFEDVDCGPEGPEGNYRQRVYRLKSLFPIDASNDDELDQSAA